MRGCERPLLAQCLWTNDWSAVEGGQCDQLLGLLADTASLHRDHHTQVWSHLLGLGRLSAGNVCVVLSSFFVFFI